MPLICGEGILWLFCIDVVGGVSTLGGWDGADALTVSMYCLTLAKSASDKE